MPIHYWSSLSWFELAFLTECDVNAVNVALFDGSMMSIFSLLWVSNWWRSTRSHHLKMHHALYRLTSVQGKLPCHCCKWFPDKTPLVYTCRVSKQHRHEKQNEKGEWSQRIRLGTSALKQKQGQSLPYKPVAMFPMTFLLRPCCCRSQGCFTCAKQPLRFLPAQQVLSFWHRICFWAVCAARIILFFVSAWGSEQAIDEMLLTWRSS